MEGVPIRRPLVYCCVLVLRQKTLVTVSSLFGIETRKDVAGPLFFGKPTFFWKPFSAVSAQILIEFAPLLRLDLFYHCYRILSNSIYMKQSRWMNVFIGSFKMNQEIENAQFALENWLVHPNELGHRPSKIEYTNQFFDESGNPCFIFKY